MEEKPLFTIITICYNSGKTISRTIQSVLNQTIKNYEYWIVDGGSTDNTLDIVEGYIPQFEGRMFYISEKDSGIYNAMNKGIKLSIGKIIGIVNSDDWLENNALELLCEATLKVSSPYSSIYCGWMSFHYINGDVSILKTNRERLQSCYRKCDMGIRHPATFVAREVYSQVGLFDESFKIMADQDFIFRCVKSCVSFVFIEKSLTNMSDGGVSNSVKYNKILFDDFRAFYHKYTNDSFEYYKRLYRSILVANIKSFIPLSVLKIIRLITN